MTLRKVWAMECSICKTEKLYYYSSASTEEAMTYFKDLGFFFGEYGICCPNCYSENDVSSLGEEITIQDAVTTHFCI